MILMVIILFYFFGNSEPEERQWEHTSERRNHGWLGYEDVLVYLRVVVFSFIRQVFEMFLFIFLDDQEDEFLSGVRVSGV